MSRFHAMRHNAATQVSRLWLLAVALATQAPMTTAELPANVPVVIAHRGASAYVPEHTLLAVTAAHMLGADYIEQDVVLTRDGVPIVLHDIHLEPTTDVADRYPNRSRDDGHFYAIDFDLDEIKHLSVVERRNENGEPVFPSRFPQASLGLQVPTLQEEIDLIRGLNRTRGHQAGWYIELKAPLFHEDEGQDIAAAVIKVLNDASLNTADSPVFLQCFDDSTLKRLRFAFETPLPLIQLIADNSWGENSNIDYDHLRTREGLARVATYAEGIGPWIPQLFQADGTVPGSLTADAHANGLLVHPYTLRADALPLGVDDVDALHSQLFLTIGVDGVFSDFPDLTRTFIDTRVAQPAVKH